MSKGQGFWLLYTKSTKGWTLTAMTPYESQRENWRKVGQETVMIIEVPQVLEAEIVKHKLATEDYGRLFDMEVVER